ncbi:MAG: CPBP family intramembrane metalloprotease [Clostridia bacterium]|nr:CPBP family intramembrane metalloprotease [Clostridia bacterium]
MLKRKSAAIMLAMLVCCAVMAIVDGLIMPHYAVKSAVKAVLFFGAPAVYAVLDKERLLIPLFKTNKNGLGYSVLFGLLVYIAIVGGYFLLKDVFDFSAITNALTGNIGVNRNNFAFVAIYISFANSFLEEFFFRGFGFLVLKKLTSSKTAAIFSSAVFSLYHVAMMVGWFSAGLYFLCIAGLFVGGLIFNLLNLKTKNIYTSWLVHMFANFAINTIGFILFGII